MQKFKLTIKDYKREIRLRAHCSICSLYMTTHQLGHHFSLHHPLLWPSCVARIEEGVFFKLTGDIEVPGDWDGTYTYLFERR